MTLIGDLDDARPVLPTIKLAIGIPAYGGMIVAHQARMWLAFGEALPMFGKRFDLACFIHVDMAGVQRARNALVGHAMQAACEWLLMLDADTWVEAHNADNPRAAGYALLRMIDDAAAAKVAVVSAPVRIRDEGVGGDRLASFRDGKALVRGELLRGLQDVDECGAACMAVDLNAVNTADAFFEFTKTRGEDNEFCRQMKAAGFRIAVDGRVRTGHLSRPFALYSE